MTEYTCERCGATYTVGRNGDPFTSIAVNYHDETREDFATSFCQDCGDELLADIREAIAATEGDA